MYRELTPRQCLTAETGGSLVDLKLCADELDVGNEVQDVRNSVANRHLG